MKCWLLIWMLVVGFMADAQNLPQPIPERQTDTSITAIPTHKLNTTEFITPHPVPSDYYAHHIGFFCKQELRLEQEHIPVTFRLGSMDYCNWLEQKPGYKYLNRNH